VFDASYGEHNWIASDLIFRGYSDDESDALPFIILRPAPGEFLYRPVPPTSTSRGITSASTVCNIISITQGCCD
jgi:hypothetical protein